MRSHCLKHNANRISFSKRCSYLLALFAITVQQSSIGLAAEDPPFITPDHNASLTLCLETLSHGWDQPCVDMANSILRSPEYTAADWEAWFNQFFNTTGHPYTDNLKSYLWYPAFGWFDEDVHYKLQTGLTAALWTKAMASVSSDPNHLGLTLYHDSSERQSLLNAHAFSAEIARVGVLDPNASIHIYEQYKTHITDYPKYFSDANTIDICEQPLIGYLRSQAWISFVETLPLTNDRKSDIAETIALRGPSAMRQNIWNDHDVLIMDNNQLDVNQLYVLDALSQGIPDELSNLRFITVRDFFSTSLERPRPIISKGRTGGQVNYYLWISGNGRLQFCFDGAPKSWPGVASKRSVNWDAWNHVAATYDGLIMKVFLNGVESNQLIAAGVPVSRSDAPLHIGMMPDFKAWMRGTLDDIKIFNRALSAVEIAQSFRFKMVDSTGLVGHWALDQDTDVMITDMSGQENHGTRQGAIKVPGHANGGLFFDGEEDSVTVDDHPSLQLDGAMTLAAWIYIANETPRLFAGPSGMVNIGSMDIGSASENSFPDDIEPRLVDTFSAIAAHEFNHVVYAYSVWQNPEMKARESQLIEQAGQDPLQYLRSMFTKSDGTSVFPTAPQEFFASMSNEYFNDTWHTLDLALSRFDQGFQEPINQFLFFAEVYSQGSNMTKAYTLDAAANLTVMDVPVGRDAQARIIYVTRGSNIYHFAIDVTGNVKSWTLSTGH